MFEDSVSSIPSIWDSMNSWFTPTVFFVLLNLVIVTIAFTSTFSSNNQQQKQPNKPQNNDAPRLFTRSPSVLQRLRSFNFHHIPDSHSHFTPPPQPSPDSDDSHFALQQKTKQTQSKFFQQTHFSHVPDSDTHFASEQKTLDSYDTHFAPEQKTKFFQQTHFSQQISDSDTHFAPEQNTHSRSLYRQIPDPIGHFAPEQKTDDSSPSIDEVYSNLRNRHVDRTNSDTRPSGGEMPGKLAARMRKSASAKSAFSHFGEEEEEGGDAVEARRPATVREGGVRAEEDDEEVDTKADHFINKFKQQLKLQRMDSIIRYKDMISRGGGK